MIYVVAADHNVHFSRVSKILELMGKPNLAGKLQHVSFSEASHLSDYLGDQTHTLEGILDRNHSAMEESITANSEKALLFDDLANAAATIGISGMVAQELANKSSHEHIFDLHRMTSFANGTGPNLRWWYAWLKNMAKSCPEPANLSNEDWESIENDDDINLLRLLVQWPSIVQSTSSTLESAPLMAYLSNITSLLAACSDRIGSSNSARMPAQVMLFQSSLVVLNNGFSILEPGMSDN